MNRLRTLSEATKVVESVADQLDGLRQGQKAHAALQRRILDRLDAPKHDLAEALRPIIEGRISGRRRPLRPEGAASARSVEGALKAEPRAFGEGYAAGAAGLPGSLCPYRTHEPRDYRTAWLWGHAYGQADREQCRAP